MNITRRNMLISVLLGTLCLVAWTAWQETLTDVPNQSAKQSSRQVRSAEQNKRNLVAGLNATDLDNSPRDPLFEAETDPFQGVNFQPIPAIEKLVAAALPPPPAPTAPPFPYRYSGRMVEIDGKSTVYLARENKLIPVEEEKIVDDSYRIDAISDKQIEMTYLPLNEKKIIQIRPSEQ